MNAHDEDERIFAALPPARGRGFAQSWWGRAWLKALEDSALGTEQLKKGRRQARDGTVGAVSVQPGRITAVVRDRDGSAYRSDMLLQELTGAEWDRFLDMAVDRAGHVAALLDREMPPHLVEDAADAGVELLPGIGDLEPECACGAWDLCPHTAALSYQVARLLDQDPFVLLLVRGRGERALLDELHVRSAARAEPGEPADPAPEGVRADEAFAAAGILPPLPAAPPAPPERGTPPSLATDAAPGPGVDLAALEFLMADTAGRAHRMLVEALAPGYERQPVEAVLTKNQDAVRLAAEAGPDVPPAIAARLASGSGRRLADFRRAVLAWRFGRAPALAVLEEDATPDEGVLARAKATLATAWEGAEGPQLRRAGTARWTVVGTDAQLRLGTDGRWWPYARIGGHWTPAGPAATDPASALTAVEAAS